MYQAKSILTPKPETDMMGKIKNKPPINIEAKIFAKILANEIQQHIKEDYTPRPLGIGLRQKFYLTYTSILIEEKINTISTDKPFDKIQQLFIVKTLIKLEIEGKFLSPLIWGKDKNISPNQFSSLNGSSNQCK